VSGQPWAAQLVILGVVVLAVIAVLALCALGSRLELARDQRKARAREREAGEQP
jgi:hypothetical protein